MIASELITAIRTWQTAEQKYLQSRKSLGYGAETTQKAVKRLDAAHKALGLGSMYQARTEDDDTIGKFVTLANEIERLQAIEARAVTINNALLTAIQSMMPFLTPDVQERMQQALQPVIDLMEQKS